MHAIETVQAIYAAFGRGDIPAILAQLSDDIDWEYGAGAAPVPWLQPLRGRAQVPQFFQALMQHLEITRFEVKHLLAGGSPEAPLVVGIVDLQATARATGRVLVETDEVHLFHFDASGRVARFRHRADTWLQASVLQPA